jgi:NAD(P) transhydrogenase subunit alpha
MIVVNLLFASLLLCIFARNFIKSKIHMTEALLPALFVLVLASFIGFEVINKIPPTLHTPLMSGSNAISGISVIGAILAAGEKNTNLSVILGLIAVILAMVNVVGGFLVTDRMLQMFKKKEVKA